MSFIKKHLLTIIGVLIGFVSGYLYYQMIGCESGSCSITSSPINSSLYGALMGGLIFSLFQNKSIEKNKE
jgi:LytS/YehU family sensor histidine kinase